MSRVVRLVLPGRLDRGRNRLAEVVAGEEPDRHASVDEHLHAADAGDAAKGADELADALLEQPAVAAGREARSRSTVTTRCVTVIERSGVARGTADRMPRRRSAAVGPASSCCTALCRVVPLRGTDTGFPSATNQTFTPAPAEPASTRAETTSARKALHFMAIRFAAAPTHFLPIGRIKRNLKARAFPPMYLRADDHTRYLPVLLP